jgi:hypothetical protein
MGIDHLGAGGASGMAISAVAMQCHDGMVIIQAERGAINKVAR